MFNDFDDDFFKDRKPFDDDFFKNHKPFDDDFFKRHSTSMHSGPRVMDIVTPVLCVMGAFVLIALCCACFRRNKYRGRVLAPPSANESTVTALPAGYPQQQYTVAVATYPVQQSGAHCPAPYPTPTPYPMTAPYPTAAPYPTSAPYPPSGPYPGGMPHPAPAPYPTTAPSAPDVNAQPPSYDQVMSAPVEKNPPYNPNYPH